ncbi:MAG: serine aminopeptidase domain-containing protein [Promethearchaeota archaeon]|jgi:pimeloyl-ACP methyl ester carboxylesterase
MNNIDLTRKRIFLLGLFLAIFVIGTVLIFITPLGIKSTYGQTVRTNDGETIVFNVFEPKRGGVGKTAIILGHGVMSNKEMLKGFAIELAAAGFVAIPFDFRGHGQSSGILERNLLTNDIDAIRSYLSGRSDIDTSSLGYFGFSMGGGPGIEVVNESTDFKCFVGAGTWLPTQVRKGTNSDPLNILMILGRYDELIMPADLKIGLSDYTGIPITDLDVNKLYGSFQEGNASMIYLDDNSNHVLGDWDPDFIRETRNFIMNTFPHVRPIDENFFTNIRLIILFTQLLGGIGLFLLIVEPLSKLLLKPEENQEIKLEVEEESLQKLSMKTIGFSLILGIPGIIIFVPVILILYLATAGFILALLFGQAFGYLLLLWMLGRKRNFNLRSSLKKPFQTSRSNLLRHFILGLILSITIALIIYLSGGLNYMGMAPSSIKIPWMFLIVPITFVIFIIYSLINQCVFQGKIGRGLKGLAKMTLLNFVFQFLYWFLYLLIIGGIMGSLFYFGSFMPFAIPLFLIMSVFSAFMYQKTGNIIAGAMVITLFFTLLICTISPYESGFNFIMRFF